MKRLIMVMTFLAACGDSQDPGWQIGEPNAPTMPTTPEQETPNTTTPDPDLPPPMVRPEVPEEPMEIEVFDNSHCETPHRLASGDRVRQTLEGLEPTVTCLGWEMRQRFYEIVVPPNHRGWVDAYGMVIYRHERLDLGGMVECAAFAPQDISECATDFVNRDLSNQTGQPATYLVAATEYEGRVGDEFTIGYEAVPLEPNSSCEGRFRISPGQSHIWDVRGGWDTYNPCQIVEAHNAFYFHLEFPPNVSRVAVQVSPPDPVSEIRPSIQVVSDMIAQYYPQCGRSDFAMENGECIATDDAYFQSINRASVVVDRPEGFTTDPNPSYLLIVNTGGSYVSTGDARMEIRVTSID